MVKATSSLLFQHYYLDVILSPVSVLSLYILSCQIRQKIFTFLMCQINIYSDHGDDCPEMRSRRVFSSNGSLRYLDLFSSSNGARPL